MERSTITETAKLMWSKTWTLKIRRHLGTRQDMSWVEPIANASVLEELKFKNKFKRRFKTVSKPKRKIANTPSTLNVGDLLTGGSRKIFSMSGIASK